MLPNAVLALIVASGLVALIYEVAYAADDRVSAPRSLIKTVPVALLCLAALASAKAGDLSWLFALGLGLGALGDLLLSREGKVPFLAGMAAFALGHLAYVAGFVPFATGLGSLGQIGAALALGLLVLSTEGWLAPRTADLRWPVRGYVLVIGAMGLMALALSPGPARPVLWSGVVLFILSDLLLALRMFVWAAPPSARWLSLALWPAYWAGQALILTGAISLGA